MYVLIGMYLLAALVNRQRQSIHHTIVQLMVEIDSERVRSKIDGLTTRCSRLGASRLTGGLLKLVSCVGIGVFRATYAPAAECER